MDLDSAFDLVRYCRRCIAALVACACAGAGSTGAASFGSSPVGEESTEQDPDQTEGDGGSSGTGASDPHFDVGAGSGSDGGPANGCRVSDDMNAVGACGVQAPPLSFEPRVEWVVPDTLKAWALPLVANLTDDDANGTIDLCDVPDVVLVANEGGLLEGYIHVLSGDDGSVHFVAPDPLDWRSTPALGDIDGDGMVEIVGLSPDGSFTAFEHDGTKKWSSTTTWDEFDYGDVGFTRGVHTHASLAIANLDNDGLPEIILGNQIVDAMGGPPLVLSELPGPTSSTTAADLDGDGDLEVVLGHAAFHHDGTLLWNSDLAPGFPQIADLDDDGLPEILLANTHGLSLIEHDGTVTYESLRPSGNSPSYWGWVRPATIHDFDGDGHPELAMATDDNFSVFEVDGLLAWSRVVSDRSGLAGGTAFDFLGDGNAEALYGDEHMMFVFDRQGVPLLEVPRRSGTGTDYPVVADIDNDGSSEILFVSAVQGAPALQVIGEAEDRWIQARRIWNQHSYHVTNVREDGTIPQFEVPNWEHLNTFRTNAQIEGGDVCVPVPAG